MQNYFQSFLLHEISGKRVEKAFRNILNEFIYVVYICNTKR